MGARAPAAAAALLRGCFGSAVRKRRRLLAPGEAALDRLYNLRWRAAVVSRYRGRVTAMFEAYDPESSGGRVDSALALFLGREAALMALLVKRYGPEPAIG